MSAPPSSSAQELIVLDTSVILRDPGIIESYSERIRTVVPEEVIGEISGLQRSNRVSHQLLETLLASQRSGFVVTPPKPEQRVDNIAELEEQGLSKVDVQLLNYAITLQQSNQNVRLATEDRELGNAARKFGIDTLRLAELQRLLFSSAAFELRQLRAGETLKQLRRRLLATGVVLGVVVTFIIVLSFVYRYSLARFTTTWGLVALVPIVGAALYWLRSRWPLSYGIVEVAVGFLTAARLLAPSQDVTSYGVIEALQIAGGLYIIVRGLDNCAKGLLGTRLERIWAKVFSRRSLGIPPTG